jgi:hypothetical protein
MGLVVQQELPALDDGLLEAGLEREAVGMGGLDVRRVAGEAVAALVLGAVHGDVGVLEQGLQILPVGRIDGDPDARREGQLPPVDLHRLLDEAQQLGSDVADEGRILEVIDQHHELVPAQPRDQIGGAHAARQSLANPLQHLVAGVVAEGVVDVLEPVEVDEDDRQMAVVPLGPHHGPPEVVGEEVAVGQCGEFVVVGQPPDLVLGAMPVGDVLVRPGDLGRRPAWPRLGDPGDLDPYAAAAGGQELHLQTPVLRLVGGAFDGGTQRLPVFG